MSGFTCLTCKVAFATNEWQKQHYKTEWHQYNLKRKVVALPAVPLEAFEKLKAKQSSPQVSDNISDDSNYCQACRKLFSSTKAYHQHCQSKKHRELELKPINLNRINSQVRSLEIKNTDPPSSVSQALSKPISSTNDVKMLGDADAQDDDSDWESIDEEDPGAIPIPPNQCLFCSLESKTIEENAKHMSSIHSFFVPDLEYVVNVVELLTYLGEKVGIDHRCLWCSYSGKAFRSTKAAQQHMISKGHSKINFERADLLLEYADFFDYSKSYPDAASTDKDEEVSIPVLDQDENWQLVLPSGSVIGHRSLLKYYKQNLRPIAERTGTSSSQRILDKVMSNYKALGWTGVKGEAAVSRAKDIQFYHRIRSRRELDIGMRGNNTLQPHLRSQVFF